MQKLIEKSFELDTSSLKLFTFMNCFEEEKSTTRNMKKVHKQKTKMNKENNK